LLLYCCCTAALLLLYCCRESAGVPVVAALLLLYCCFTAAVLLLYCCCTAVAFISRSPHVGAQVPVRKDRSLFLCEGFLKALFGLY
jgi:hypothetical protein